MANYFGIPSGGAGGAGDYTGQAAGDIGAARSAGFFSPTGSAMITRQVRSAALRNADNIRRRNAILNRIMGLDPNQARVAAVGADTAATGETANALNESQLQQSLGNQAYFRGLFGTQLGQENQRALLKYQHDLNAPTFGGELGGLIGTGIGAFTGGYGKQFGTRLAG